MRNAHTGGVLEGSHKAGKLGFPTVNIPCEDSSLSGIYAGEVTAEGTAYHAAIFVDTKRKLLEAHLLDFSGDLYGKEITMTLFERLREHQDFADEQLLKAAIADDVARTRAYFTSRG